MDGISALLGSSIAHSKHFPTRKAKLNRRRTYNYIVRAAAKRYAQSNAPGLTIRAHPDSTSFRLHPAYPREIGPAPAADSGADPGQRRVHLENLLAYELSRPIELARDPKPQPRNSRPRVRWASEAHEGRDLARSNVSIPSDRSRLVRRPTLEREDAFRDATTAKGNVRLRRADPVISGDEDAQVAELYRMGLLYDEDEKDCTGGFGLNSIKHDEPLYSIRPAKRARKLRKGRDYDEPLHLDLSFADLGNDNAIAHYLMSPSHAETTTADDEASQAESRQDEPQENAPMRVIYELSSAVPSFDVDTSQPPDLITDLLSDYDCFSESELDDTPSQQEVYDSAANPPTDAWIMLGDDS